MKHFQERNFNAAKEFKFNTMHYSLHFTTNIFQDKKRVFLSLVHSIPSNSHNKRIP